MEAAERGGVCRANPSINWTACSGRRRDFPLSKNSLTEFNYLHLNLENILGSLVGESERKLKAFFKFCKALAPIIVFVDEIDQSDISRRGNNSGNPVAANLFSAVLRFMSDES